MGMGITGRKAVKKGNRAQGIGNGKPGRHRNQRQGLGRRHQGLHSATEQGTPYPPTWAWYSAAESRVSISSGWVICTLSSQPKP